MGLLITDQHGLFSFGKRFIVDFFGSRFGRLRDSKNWSLFEYKSKLVLDFGLFLNFDLFFNLLNLFFAAKFRVISRQIDNKESMWNVNENSLLLV
jgi:hypothetical protein